MNMATFAASILPYLYMISFWFDNPGYAAMQFFFSFAFIGQFSVFMCIYVSLCACESMCIRFLSLVFLVSIFCFVVYSLLFVCV